jgi:hypothetical protein
MTVQSFSSSTAEALLIAEDGPSARLDELVDHATANAVPAQKANAERFAAWSRFRAGRAR